MSNLSPFPPRVRRHLLTAGPPLVFALVLATTAFAQPTVLTGRTEGAYYRIEVPTAWNGSVVMWNHGLGLGDAPRPLEHRDLGRLADEQLSHGTAVAATGLRSGGWALFDATADLANLLEAFRSRVGEPDRVFLTGASMGALTSLVATDTGELPVDGVLALCGPLAGARFWDTAVDLRLVYDFVCEGVPEAAIPGGAAGLPADGSFTAAAVGRAVGHCVGTREPTLPGGADRRRQLVEATLVEPVWLPVWMLLSTIGLSELVHDADKLDGLIGAGNAGVVYEDPVIDAGIDRVDADFLGAIRLWESSTSLATHGDARIVSLHTSRDGLAMPEHATELASRVQPEWLTTAIVHEERPSHCGFTLAEEIAAWRGLVSWTETGVQPDVADLQSGCEQVALPYATCRFDPTAEAGPLDDVIRPRNALADQTSGRAPELGVPGSGTTDSPDSSDSSDAPELGEGLSLDLEMSAALEEMFGEPPQSP